VKATCRSTGAVTLDDVAGPSCGGTPILKDSRIHGPFDGLCAPIRAGCDEVGFVLLGTDHLLTPSDYERFLLQGMCEAYARAGLALLPMRADPPSLTQRETECLDSVARGIVVSNAIPRRSGLGTINPIFTWVRLAQRIPEHIDIDSIPADVRLVVGMTATVEIEPKPKGQQQWCKRRK
jgi:hypothetical protein